MFFEAAAEAPLDAASDADGTFFVGRPERRDSPSLSAPLRARAAAEAAPAAFAAAPPRGHEWEGEQCIVNILVFLSWSSLT